jgi:glycosyltransferase involved in cell wall biosynthesis
MRLVFASTVPVTLNAFMRGQLAWIAAQGHEVHVVASPGPEMDAIAEREGVEVHPVPMQREIALAADLRALRAWVRLLRDLDPDVLVVGTPKAGLLGGLAGALLRIPRRVYLMRGARFEGVTGLKGSVLRATERLSCAAAHEVIAVSPSLGALAVRQRVVGAGKLTRVGAGSSNGVDVARVHPPDPTERALARQRWDLGSADVAVSFVGRLTTDKGLDVLGHALGAVEVPADTRMVVLLAGPDEGLASTWLAPTGVLVRRLGRVEDVPGLLHATDLLVLPTQREGFPNVVLEAAASGLPVVTTDATGAIDSVVDGVTGLIVARQDSRALAAALSRLVASSDVRRSMGKAARDRVEREFENHAVWRGMLQAYLGTTAPGHTARPVRAGGG